LYVALSPSGGGGNVDPPSISFIAARSLRGVRTKMRQPQPVAPQLPYPRAKWAQEVLERLSQPKSAAKDSSSDVPAALATVALMLAMARPTLRAPRQREQRLVWMRQWVCRLLYTVTVFNPCFSVLANDYTFVRAAAKSWLAHKRRSTLTAIANDQEEKLRHLVIGVGAIKPRRLFAAGATLRGLQLHTPLRQVFDPPAHFGAIINLLALFDGVAWPASFTLGWAVAEPLWTLDEIGSNTTLPVRRDHMASIASDAAIPADSSSVQGWRDGVRVQMHVPALHASVIAVAVLVAKHKLHVLRWVLVALCGAVRWG
jgi:hypothetical protein